VSVLSTDVSIPFVVQPMKVQDIPEVMAVEKVSFPFPWSASAYRHELTQNELSHYIVVRERQPPRVAPQTSWLDRWLRRSKSRQPPVIGYGGFWVLNIEAHISTIAVQPNWRGHGLGELLLTEMIEKARSLKAQVVTLEVRVSNHVAQNLYRKYLFEEVGLRRRYYRNNNEDALIMTTPDIDDSTFVENLNRCRAKLDERLRNLIGSVELQALNNERRTS
jgi:ribosomal-protein-alanine N-acetyltransferase